MPPRTFCIFERYTRKRHEPKGEGGSVGVVEINQKHLSTLLDRGLILSWAVASYPLNNADAPLCLLLLCLMADEMELSWERGAFVSSQTLYSSRAIRMTNCSIVERSYLSYAKDSFAFESFEMINFHWHFAPLPLREPTRLFFFISSSKLQSRVRLKSNSKVQVDALGPSIEPRYRQWLQNESRGTLLVIKASYENRSR